MKMYLSRVAASRQELVGDDAVLSLQRDEGIAVAGACRLRIRCEAGQLWITEAGRLEDIVLAAGQSTTAPLQGHVLVRALTESRVAIEHGDARGVVPAAAGWLRRWCNLARLRGFASY